MLFLATDRVVVFPRRTNHRTSGDFTRAGSTPQATFFLIETERRRMVSLHSPPYSGVWIVSKSLGESQASAMCPEGSRSRRCISPNTDFHDRKTLPRGNSRIAYLFLGINDTRAVTAWF